MLCSPNAAGLGCVDEDVILLDSLDVFLELVHLCYKSFHTVLLSNSVKRHHIVSLFLELFVQSFPLLLESGNKFITLVVWHQELLAVTFVLFFNLHLTNEVVLVLDLVLNLGQVFRDGTVALLLKVVFILLGGQFGCSKDVFNGVGNNEVLVGDKTMDRLFITLGHCAFSLTTTFKL